MGTFIHEGRKIGFEGTEEYLKFLATSSKDIDLAIYYIESHSPHIANRKIKAEKVESLGSSLPLERFVPMNFLSDQLDYTNYNYVLLNSDCEHDFSKVVTRYASFFQGLKDQRRRKVSFLDFDFELLSLIPRIPLFNVNNSSEEFVCQYNDGSIGNRIDTIMFQAQSFTKGLKKLFGHDSKYRLETNLEKRVVFR